jgi:hypothetical protein
MHFKSSTIYKDDINFLLPVSIIYETIDKFFYFRCSKLESKKVSNLQIQQVCQEYNAQDYNGIIFIQKDKVLFSMIRSSYDPLQEYLIVTPTRQYDHQIKIGLVFLLFGFTCLFKTLNI